MQIVCLSGAEGYADVAFPFHVAEFGEREGLENITNVDEFGASFPNSVVLGIKAGVVFPAVVRNVLRRCAA